MVWRLLLDKNQQSLKKQVAESGPNMDKLYQSLYVVQDDKAQI